MFKKVFPLSAIIGLRFLGLFLVLPVISVYAITIQGEDYNPLLVGIVVGGYALTQALFQLPFGILSDKIGRKITITLGLIIAIIGSLIAANAETIEMLILGRFLQGAGAVGSVITAMIGDLVPEEVRGKAMAIMGGTIGMAFGFSMILGPTIGGLENGMFILFNLTAALSLFSIYLLFAKVPNPPRIKHTYHGKARLTDILKDKALLGLFIANFLQKGMMIAAFVMIPKVLKNSFDWDVSEFWYLYIPAILLGMMMMGPAAIFGEKHNKPKQIFLIAIALFSVGFYLMGQASGIALFATGTIFFFIAFHLMEPLLQSMITKFAKVHQKGAALGLGNTLGYFGSFLGGVTAGYLLLDQTNLGLVVAVIGLVWFVLTLILMRNPEKMSFIFLEEAKCDINKVQTLEQESKIEWYINDTEGLVVIKFPAALASVEEMQKRVEK